MTEYFNHNPHLTLAVVLISGIVLGKLLYRLKLPGITGQILAGILIGPYGLKIFSLEMIHHFEPITDFALGLIAVTIGTHLNYQKLYNAWKRMTVIILCEILIVPVFIFIPLYFFLKLPIPVCLVLSVIGVETSPASSIHIIKEKRAKGILTNTIISEVALNNVFSIILFEIMLIISLNFFKDQVYFSAMDTLFIQMFFKIIISISLGISSGVLLIFFSRKVKLRSNFFSLSLVAILLTSGLSQLLALPPLLSELILGIMIGNFKSNGIKVVESFELIEYSIFACFFTVAGAHLDFASLKTVGLAGIIYIVLRTLGKITAPTLAAYLSKAPRVIKKWLGLSLLPQAGISIGLVLLLQSKELFAPYFSLISTIILTSVVFNELVGPILTGITIKKSGEADKDRSRLIEFLHEEFIKMDMKAKNKWQALEELIDFLIISYRLDGAQKKAVKESVLNLEKEISTAIGDGVAIPHGKLDINDKIMGVIGVSQTGIDFKASDGKKVKLIILFLTPSNHFDFHLRILAGINQLLAVKPGVRQKVMQAKTAAEVYELITGEEMDHINYFLEMGE